MLATHLGSLPGSDFPAAVRLGSDTLSGPVAVPELPGRGPASTMVARGVAMLSGLTAELTAHGWRLADHAGVDHGRAVSQLRRDLDDLEEVLHDTTQTLKLSVIGPWTLAATAQLAGGEAVLADRGASRDLHQALAEGLHDLLGELHRRFPDATWLLQVDEPSLPAVVAGGIPTASGLDRHRRVDPDQVVVGLAEVRRATAGPMVLHCCAPGLDLALLERAGVDTVALDLGQLGARDLDPLAGWVEAGRGVWWGALPTAAVPPPAPQWDTLAFDQFAHVVRTLGVDPAVVREHGVLTPACGLAHFTPVQASAALRAVQRAAERAEEVDA